jgi:hypothetical protein
MHSLQNLDLIIDGKHTVPEPELVSLGEAIIQEFIRQRPRFIPGRPQIPRKALPRFYEAARLARDRKQTAAEYVATALSGMSLLQTFWPSGIASERVLKAADTARHNDATEVARYRAMLGLFSRMRGIYGTREVLEDPSVLISPLVRYVCARTLGQQDIAAEWAAQARSELRENPKAREVFEEFASDL